MQPIKIYRKPPEDFEPIIETSACLIEVGDRLLLLQSSERKEHAKQWGIPAGKLEQGETPLQGLLRELYEEIGIILQDTAQIQFIESLYVVKPSIQFIFHVFKIQFANFPSISLSDEHINYKWVTIEETKELQLIIGAAEIFTLYYS